MERRDDGVRRLVPDVQAARGAEAEGRQGDEAGARTVRRKRTDHARADRGEVEGGMNENTTTEGEKMDKERIAELCKEYEESPEGLREEIANLRSHIARLESRVGGLEAQAAAQAGGVVVPGLTDESIRYEWCRLHLGIEGDPDESAYSAFEEGARQGYSLAASRARALPASRVLRDGEARIGAEELAVLREVVRLVAEARERCDKRPRGAGGQRMPDEIDDLLCRLYEIGAHPALRAQATEGGA